MKKIFITFLMCCPLMCAAQSEWEAPVTNQNKETKEVKDTAKKSHKADAKTKTLDTKNIKDWKYIQKGAVPEVDGKVVFTHDVDVNGKNARTDQQQHSSHQPQGSQHRSTLSGMA